MDIPHIIKDLLTKREGLVVPGLGSFISESQPASIRRDKKIIQPPRKQLRLDPTVQTDSDDILAREVASKKHISKEKARDHIRKYVEGIHQALQQKGSYQVAGIGLLEKKTGGVIELKQAETPDSDLGFEAIAAEPFELESAPQPTKTPSSPPPPKPSATKKKKSGKKTLWITVLSVFLLLVGYAGWYTGFYDYLLLQWEQRQEDKQTAEVRSSQKPEKGQETEKNKQPESQIDQALDKMTDKKKALMYQENRDTSTYYLVAGSFKRYDNAREFREQLKHKGYTARILEKDNLFRVTVQTFNKKEDALVKLYQMRDTGRLKSIWLLTVREKDR